VDGQVVRESGDYDAPCVTKSWEKKAKTRPEREVWPSGDGEITNNWSPVFAQLNSLLNSCGKFRGIERFRNPRPRRGSCHPADDRPLPNSPIHHSRPQSAQERPILPRTQRLFIAGPSRPLFALTPRRCQLLWPTHASPAGDSINTIHYGHLDLALVTVALIDADRTNPLILGKVRFLRLE
jgi:hypothetical protein